MRESLKKFFLLGPLAFLNRLLRINSSDPLFVTLVATSLLLTVFFYSTNFRRELENFFHDTRTRLMPPVNPSNFLTIVEITNDSIKKLEGENIRLRLDSNGTPYLNVRRLTQLAGILANTEAKAVVLLMPEYAFPIDDPDWLELIDIIRFDPRFIVGTVGYNQLIPNMQALPQRLVKIKNQVASAETFRSRSNAIVRTLPYLSYRGIQETINLPALVAGNANEKYAPQSGSFVLKHYPPTHYPVIDISEVIASPETHMERFNGRIAVVGYTTPRTIGIQTTEQPFANTPLTGYAATNLTGISTTHLMANAIENIILKENLKAAPNWLTILQAVGVIFFCVVIWDIGGVAATAGIIALWTLLLLAHAGLYRWFSLLIPLSDAFLATIIVSILASSRRLRLDLKRLAEQKVSTNIKSDLAKFQAHFLTGFSNWLTATTGTIVELVQNARAAQIANQQDQKLYDRIFISAGDLTEYLSGVNQLSRIDEITPDGMKLDFFDLEPVLSSILRRFTAKAEDRNIKFSLFIEPNCRQIKSNQYFVDAIIYNFVSNAVKYAHPSSSVEIKVYKTNEGSTIISVSDEGPGIPAHLQKRVFERFYRINDDRLYSAKGTGIGLYLCKFFAESLGGKVELTSDVGQGSEFRVILP